MNGLSSGHLPTLRAISSTVQPSYTRPLGQGGHIPLLWPKRGIPSWGSKYSERVMGIGTI